MSVKYSQEAFEAKRDSVVRSYEICVKMEEYFIEHLL